MGLVDAVCSMSQFVWYIAFLIILPLAIYFTYRYKALQVSKLPESAKLAFTNDGTKDQKSLSSFETFMMGLGERVGIGNIVSIAAAIMIGGPGAIFWMWIFAILVAIFSFAETTVSQVYKTRRDDGRFAGGPAFNMRNGYGKKKASLALGVLFAILGLVLAGTISSMFAEQFSLTLPMEDTGLRIAIGMAIVLVLVLILSNKTVARANAQIVTVMAVGWIGICIAVIIANWNNMGNAFAMIFHYAFVIPDELTQYGFLSIEGVWEGIKGPVGALIGTVIITGLKRGVFSNEGGVGSISVISSMAEVKHPVKQGYVQAFGVFIDTIVICTCTGLVILSYGTFSEIYALDLNFAPLVTEIMSQSLFGDAAKYLITIFMSVFIATSLISLMNLVESSTYSVTGNKKILRMSRYLMAAFSIIACFMKPEYTMYLADLVLAICAIINTTMIFGKRKVLRETYDDYVRQKKEGIREPEFHSEVLSDRTGVTVWK